MLVNNKTTDIIEMKSKNLIVITNRLNSFWSVSKSFNFLKNVFCESEGIIETDAIKKPIPIEFNVIVPNSTLSRFFTSVGVIPRKYMETTTAKEIIV